MRGWIPVVAVLMSSFFVGCIQDGPGDGGSDEMVATAFLPPVSAERLPVPDVDFETAFDPNHGGNANAHTDPTAHAWAYGLELIGYHPLTDPTEQAAATASFIALDTWGSYVCVAHWVHGGPAGAEIVDISDPTDPRHVASAASGMVNSDCMFTDDGEFLLVAGLTGSHDGVPLLPAPLGDAGANGVSVYDVSDKTDPVFLFHDADSNDANQYHNIFTAQIGDTHYVFQTYTGHILALDVEERDLRVVSTVPVAEHDMWVGRHPVTGEWLMVTGAAEGIVIYNLDDPTEPVELGVWDGHDRLTGWHRQWPVMGTVDGRALMLVAGEEGCSEPTYYTVLDFTDPADVFERGSWTIPTGCATQHEFESFDGYFATANYHQALWLIDIGSSARADDPVTLGYYFPHEVAQEHGGTTNPPNTSAPWVWGAAFDDRGYVVTADLSSGLYVLSFGATQPVAAS